MQNQQAQTLARMFELARKLNLFYLSKLKEVDPFLNHELGGLKFNSIYWLTAHLLWAEDNLIVKMTGGTSDLPIWLQHYHLGADGSLHAGHGSFKELLDLMKTYHQFSLDYVRNLSDEKLNEDNISKFGFGDGDVSNRLSIMHAIRHESTHTGHFSWLAKMAGVNTI